MTFADYVEEVRAMSHQERLDRASLAFLRCNVPKDMMPFYSAVGMYCSALGIMVTEQQKQIDRLTELAHGVSSSTPHART
jgi:hypothetical protein